MATIFDHKKLEIHTKTLPNGMMPPMLKADMYNGNPQLFVLTGVRKGEGVTYMRAGLEPKTAGIICELIETLADETINRYTMDKRPAENTEKNVTAVIECKAGREKEHVANVVVGKDESGFMFISIIDKKQENAPIIQFKFGYDIFHPIKMTGNANFNPAFVSCVAAKDWAKRTRAYFDIHSVTNPPEKAQNNNNGGNNGNRGNYNNGGNKSYGGNGGYNNNGGGNYNNNNNNYTRDETPSDDDVWAA